MIVEQQQIYTNNHAYQALATFLTYIVNKTGVLLISIACFANV